MDVRCYFRIFIYVSVFLCTLPSLSSAQSTDQNFILSRTYTVPNAAIQSGSSFWGTPQQVRSQLIYLDALGKQRQQISVYGSSSATTDLIQQTDYDSLHRPVLQYLPVPSGSGNKGSFSSISGNSYYKSVSNNVISGADQFYSKTSYEKSPLSRVSQVQAPGVTGNGVRSVFKVSDGSIKRYQAGTDLTTISQAGTYAAGELTYTEAKDENDKTVQAYTDYQGRTVLKRVVQPSNDYLDTYYVYGATGQLRAVLQPEFQVTGKNDVNRYAFLYLYDAKGNLTDKKVPGAKPIKMTYDSRDRLETLTDGNGKVFKYSYDSQLNRLTQTQLGSQTISVNYYDSYPTEIPSLAFKVSDIFPEWASSPAIYFLKSSPTAQVSGLLTASDQYLFNADGNPMSDFLRTVTYYNQKGQVIQVVRQLYGLSGGATERISYLLDFSGKVIRERTDQSSSSWSFHLEKGFAYDHMDRLVKVMHRVWKGDYATAAVKQYTHSEITYDAVGQPKTKKLHGTMQELSYKNHLRGWLGTVRSTAFDLTLNYLPNGNIENLGWQAGGRNGTLQMTYDAANRLKTATGGGSFTGNDESLTYDRNGNINTLQRNEGSVNIDQLTYAYQGNQLQGVSEATNVNVGFVKGSTEAIQYLYDDNGNLKEDKHRNQTLQYNALNLISSMKRAGGQVLSYIYDASGTKHQLVAPGQTTTYAGAFEYQGEGNLKRIAVEEGQIVRQGDNFTVQYYLKDHLGNVRVVLNETGQAQQVTEYHAFGKAVSQTASNWQTNRYLYNGKELQPETEYLDYGARQYDPVLGRWMSIDPLSEKMRRWSPYVYAFNNPLRFIDPDGMRPTPLEAAMMSKHIYGDKVKLIGGWKVSTAFKDLQFLNENTGFKSGLYERTVDNVTEYVFATAGTEDLYKDGYHDLKQLGGVSEQYSQSKTIASILSKSIKGELTFTGHSLGGGLAETNSVNTGRDAITFNAAGASLLSKGLNQKKSKIDAYILATDPLNFIQRLSDGLSTAGGNKHYLIPSTSRGLYNGHSIDSVIDALSTANYLQQTLNPLKSALSPPTIPVF